MASISSESHGHLDDEEEAKAPLEDGVIQVESRYNNSDLAIANILKRRTLKAV